MLSYGGPGCPALRRWTWLPCSQTVDLAALLLYIHEFFDALGPEELRKRGAREDKPVCGGGERGTGLGSITSGAR